MFFIKHNFGIAFAQFAKSLFLKQKYIFSILLLLSHCQLVTIYGNLLISLAFFYFYDNSRHMSAAHGEHPRYIISI